MQAMILAAGKGSRLGPYTKDNTKCMLEVGGDKLIDLSLQKLSYIGITKLILVVGYQKENLMEYLGDQKYGIDIVYVDNPLFNTTNNIYSLYLARDYLKEDDTLLLESDLIYDLSILEGLLADKRPSLAVVDKYQSWMDGTVVKLDRHNKITSFVPKTFFDFSEIEKYYKTVNIYKFSKNFSVSTYVPFLEAYSQALGNNEYYEQVLRVVLQLESQELEAYPLNGERWYEIDDVQDKDNAELIFAKTPELKLSLTQKRFGGYWRFPDFIDFCYLVNPYFPDPVFIDEYQSNLQTLLTQYPSGSNTQSLLASKLYNVEPNQIAVSNGAAEVINILSDVIEGSFGLMEPTFYEYIDAIGIDRIRSKISNQEGFFYTINELLDLAKSVDNIILINPDNPSGNMIPKKDILKLLDYLLENNKKLILDESFIDFSTDGFNESLLYKDILNKYSNLIIIKSISKSYGVPGARLGIVASSNTILIKDIINKLSIWNINSFGEFFLQVIGKYKKKYLEGCKKIICERSRFITELSNISFLTVYPSEANYVLCRIKNKYTATELSQKLLFENNLFIKDLSNKKGFENGEYVRIAVRDRKDNNCLIDVLKAL